ncbi:hypothetical protein Tco_1210902 [Tanacetum coccineum]
MVFNSPCLTDKKELIHHEVEMVINSPWIMPLLGTKGLASPEQTATVGLFNKATKTANYMVLEGVLMKNKDAASSRDIQLICAEFSSIQVKTQADWMLLQSSYFNPQVPTGRVVVPTGRYVVPAGKVIIIVSPGRLSLVPTGRVLSPGRVKVGISSVKVVCMVGSSVCKVESLPLTYLGLPIRSNTNRVASWKVLVDRFKAKLSGWKASLLSIGGRLTLIKCVLGSLMIYYMSIFKSPEMVIKELERLRASFFWGVNENKKKHVWVKWSNVLASFNKGGLGVGSLKGFNVIKSIHGVEAGMDLNDCQSNGLWSRIVDSINQLRSSGAIPFCSIRYKVGDGSLIRFWLNTWVRDLPLRDRFNRLYHLENFKDCMVRDRFSNGSSSWNWIRPILSGRSRFDSLTC